MIYEYSYIGNINICDVDVYNVTVFGLEFN